MSKKKSFNIPRGGDEDIDELRHSIMDKINGDVSESFQASKQPQPQQYQSQGSQVNPGNNYNAPQQNNPYLGSQVEAQPRPVAPPPQYTYPTDNTFQAGSVEQNQEPQNDPFAPQGSSFTTFETSQYQPSFDKQQYAQASHSNEPVTYKPKKRKSASRAILTLLFMVVIIFGISWALREFVFQAYEIPSGSMERTIMTGDMVFAEKISPKFASPKNGDIITFKDPLNPDRVLIKRVIATAGQTVNIKNNKLYVDGEEVNESYINGLPTTTLKNSKNISYPYVVPSDSLWVMGDNRTNSQDSRYFGPISKDSVIGHALCVYWPFSDMKGLC